MNYNRLVLEPLRNPGGFEGAIDQEAEGVALCAETLQAIAAMPGVSGVHFPSTGRPDLIAAAIDAAGLGSGFSPS